MMSPKAPLHTIWLAQPRGFCAGVERAITIVERALARFGAPVYVRHEVVHNRFVVAGLRDQGVIFIEDLDDVPPGSVLVFSAHGVSRAVRDAAAARGFLLFDATCPLVAHVHREVARLRALNHEIIMIGHRGHPEVEGTMGQAPDGMWLVENAADVANICVADANRLAFVTQTTFSIDDAAAIVAALHARFPGIVGQKKDDICYATQNRQDAVKALAACCDGLIVVGSPNSSNTNRLRDVACKQGVAVIMVDSAAEIEPGWLVGKHVIGITAGASAPEVLVEQVIAHVRHVCGAAEVLTMAGVAENVVFSLPKALHGAYLTP